MITIGSVIRSLCSLLCFTTLAVAGTKNLVYKGSTTTTDLIGNVAQTSQMYLVLGEDTAIDTSSPDYTKVNGTLVIVAAKNLPAKRYIVASAGVYRTLEQDVVLKGKTRIREIFVQCSEGGATDSGTGFHSVFGVVLAGIHSLTLGSIYDAPESLKGYGLSSFASLNPSPPSSGSAGHSLYSYTLVKTLTDPIPGGEALANSVKRVTDYLAARGFIELAQ